MIKMINIDQVYHDVIRVINNMRKHWSFVKLGCLHISCGSLVLCQKLLKDVTFSAYWILYNAHCLKQIMNLPLKLGSWNMVYSCCVWQLGNAPVSMTWLKHSDGLFVLKGSHFEFSFLQVFFSFKCHKWIVPKCFLKFWIYLKSIPMSVYNFTHLW